MKVENLATLQPCFDQEPGEALSWTDIEFESEFYSANEQNQMITSKNIILGSGTFGTVIRALLVNKSSTSDSMNHISPCRVAIKILTSQSTHIPMSNNLQTNFDQIRIRALQEAAILSHAKRRMQTTNHIIDALGYIDSPLPDSICALLGIPLREPAVCLILRYEGGGSLLGFINHHNKLRHTIPMQEKLRLLLDIATGLSDLHAAGIVHADIKPENILLSDDDPPRTRLADFGLSHIRDESSEVPISAEMMMSKEAKTTRTQGTLTYCAPEQLVNPYQLTMNASELTMVNQASRRTDIYSFALLAWQLLAQRRPFSEVKGEVMLCSHVHSGARPSLFKLPSDTPEDVVMMITSCWDKQRESRLSASDCVGILHRSLQMYLQPTDGEGDPQLSLVVPLPAFDKPKSPLRSSLSSFMSTRRRSGSADSLDSNSGSGTDFTALRKFLNLRATKMNRSGASAEGDVADESSDPQLLSIYSDLDGKGPTHRTLDKGSQLGTDRTGSYSWSRSFFTTLADESKLTDLTLTLNTTNPLRQSRNVPLESSSPESPPSPPRTVSPESESRRGSRRSSFRPRDSRESFGSFGTLSEASPSPASIRHSSTGSLSRIIDQQPAVTNSRRFYGRVRDSAGRLSSEFKAELKTSISSKVLLTLNGSDDGHEPTLETIQKVNQFSESEISAPSCDQTDSCANPTQCRVSSGHRMSDEGVSVMSSGATTASLSRPVSDNRQCNSEGRKSTDDTAPSPGRMMLRIPSFALSFRSGSSGASSPVREEISSPGSPSRLTNWFGSFRKEVS